MKVSPDFKISYLVSDRILAYKFKEVPTVDIYFVFEALLQEHEEQLNQADNGSFRPLRMDTEHSNISPPRTLNSHGSNRNI